MPPAHTVQTLNELFLSFASYGTRQPETLLDGAKFSKLFKDCKVVAKDLTGTDLDIIFSKAGSSSAWQALPSRRGSCQAESC